MTEVVLDVETRSSVDLKRCGTFRYAAACELLLLAWAVDDGPVQLWDAMAEPMPRELCQIIVDQSIPLIAHNAAFEQAVLAHTLPVNHQIAPERWRCSMVRALAHGLPGKLETLAQVLNLQNQKDPAGTKLMRLFCIPPPKSYKKRTTFATRETHPAEWEQFKEYCRQDVRAEVEAWAKMPGYNYPNNTDELALWHLDQQINQRGYCVDSLLCESAIEAIGEAQERLGERAKELTGGDIASATQRDALFAYLQPLLAEEGINLPNMQAATLEKLVDEEKLPDWVGDLISVRLQASTSSTAKYKRALDAMCEDGRLRGSLQFAGASRTARWGGRIIQPQNFPRPTMTREAIESAIEALKAGTAGLEYA